MSVSMHTGLPIEELPAPETVPVAFKAKLIENLICRHISVPLSPIQLETAEISARYVDPIIYDLEKKHFDESLLYCVLACQFFFRASSHQGRPSHRRLMETRVQVCSRAARHLVHDFEPDRLARALVYDFYPLSQGGSRIADPPRYLRVSALELAVKVEAKQFLMEPPVFAVVNDIWNGILVVERHTDPNLPPRLRHSVTDVRRTEHAASPLLRHLQRLASASVFLVLYLLLIQQDPQQVSPLIESLFGLWACGYALDEFKQLHEFGRHMYFMSLWNVLDSVLVVHVVLYGLFRLVSIMLPSMLSRGNMIARGILITAGLFIVPRLFSVFDNNRIFSNMVFSLRKVSTDFLLSWFIVMMFSIGVWVSVAFSVPRVRLAASLPSSSSSPSSSSPSSSLSSPSSTGIGLQGGGQENGGRRTALAMFKMVFSDAGELWDNWFSYTYFDRVALCFYLILAQFVMPTVVTAVLANSFANIRESSEEEFYYMRAVQTLQKLKSPQMKHASFEQVPPLNFVAWLFEWLELVLPSAVYEAIARPARLVSALPERVLESLSRSYMLRSRNKRRNQEKASQERLQQEVDRSLGESEIEARSRHVAKRERLQAKFGLVKEVFTNEKVARSLMNHPEWALADEDELESLDQVLIKEKLASIEATLARLESLLSERPAA